MKNNLQTKWTLLLSGVIACCLSLTGLQAQSFPTPTGFTLPNGKTIVITYDVDVNANACPTSMIPGGDISNQSNVSGSNFPTVQTDDPAAGRSSLQRLRRCPGTASSVGPSQGKGW